MSAIWIDLENTPHVLFFAPIIREFEARGIRVALTARDFAQTVELAKQHGLNPKVIGREQGSNPIRKALGIMTRTIGLMGEIRDQEDIRFALGHGSRGMLMAASVLRIPSMTLYDYEGANVEMLNRLSDFVMTPEIIPFKTLEPLGLTNKKHRTYPGLKEEVYLQDFVPDASIYRKLGLDSEKLVITIRPPSETAHYREGESFSLFDGIMALLLTRRDAELVVLARTNAQRSALAAKYQFTPNVRVLDTATDGPNLLFHSDLVIGGGGTMNREAAVLGVPVASIFKGKMGAVDAWLIEAGKMVMVNREEDVLSMLLPREKVAANLRHSLTRESILTEILLHVR